MDYEILLTPKQVAEQLKCTRGTLANWRTKEIGPRFTKLPNGRVYYTQQSIDEYLNEDQHSNRFNNARLIPLSIIMSVHTDCGINTV